MSAGREIARGALIYVIARVIGMIIVKLLPVELAVLVAVVSYLERLPWTLILLCAGAMFAFVSTGVLRFWEWLERRDPASKLVFANASIGLGLGRDATTGKVKSIEAINLGLHLRNHASFPISYVVDEISSSFEGRVQPKPVFDNMGGIVEMNGATEFSDASIDLGGLPIKRVMEGTLKFKLRYGREGSEKHRIDRNLKVYLSVTEEGHVQSRWNDSV